MKNHQPPRGPVTSAGTELDVHSIFPTIQGEGPFAGRAAVFVRLADCNLQCPLCDTDYTGGLGRMALGELVDRIEQHDIDLVVLTGGEPFRQNISPLVARLAWTKIVQVETNGMLRPQGDAWRDAFVVVSPKTHRLDESIAAEAEAFKYVLRAGDLADDGLPRSALGHPLPVGKVLARPPKGFTGHVYIQPADEQDPVLNKANTEAAIAAVMAKGNHYTLGVQMHKIIGVE